MNKYGIMGFVFVAGCHGRIMNMQDCVRADMLQRFVPHLAGAAFFCRLTDGCHGQGRRMSAVTAIVAVNLAQMSVRNAIFAVFSFWYNLCSL